ncbi:type 1 glutamine amidotransferase domain-containing protein [Flagellimonas sp. HMM57]|uniref:type 1 glutamine amidotransferase domain-containing protein n=1 Tax=unclassified Flagellimonas TaxID=2644544 RepID=UPI0013D0D951|nr:MULTISPECIES: type 1 glutamine amidotransferase domain-containing protein [unclassified Flagellimonas]UII75810.1 type 1 glutamine amidotransferase domain-containing protein [Flagellimonas sp. HMM57]
MLKKYPIFKWTLLVLTVLFVLILSFGLWFKSLIPPKNTEIAATKIEDLPYLSQNILPVRGKILAVVTSTKTMGNSDKSTGYELTELARAYYVFKANGFEVDIASPLGGKPPVVIDDEDMGVYDFAFLNDATAQNKVDNTIPLKDVVKENYEAVFFVGGKGAMFDFPKNKNIQDMVRDYYQSNKVIGAVCHGPAALVNVTLDNGRSLLENKRVSAFTNDEELLLIPEAASIFPFLLQDKLIAQGARFKKGEMYLDKISHDANLVTGQNPWSVWSVAETMIEQMGHKPKFREITDEENAVNILITYEKYGAQSAKELITKILKDEKMPINRVLIAKHSIIAAMKGDIGRFVDIIALVSFIKQMEA